MNNTRQYIEDHYDVDQSGRCQSGEYAGQMIYVPFFWEDAVRCGQVSDRADAVTFVVTAQDRKQFPELSDRRFVHLRLSRGRLVGEINWKGEQT